MYTSFAYRVSDITPNTIRVVLEIRYEVKISDKPYRIGNASETIQGLCNYTLKNVNIDKLMCVMQKWSLMQKWSNRMLLEEQMR